MFGLQLPELIIILLIVLLFFGATRLPEVASSLGKSIRAFRKEDQTTDEASRPQASEGPKQQESKPEKA